MRKFLLFFCMTALTVAFTSCDIQDEDTIYDRLVGRTWIGNLGFMDGLYELESGIKLTPDGFGTDDQWYYAEPGLKPEHFHTFTIQWDMRGNDLYISYGRYGPELLLQNLYVGQETITGQLYINGTYWDNVQLQMQY